MTPTLATVLEFSDFAVIAWLFIVFVGATAFTARKPDDSRRIERKLDALLKHHGISVQPHAVLSEEVQRLARDPSQKIAVIELHRKQTGLGWAEAKADIEDFIRSVQDFIKKIQ
jgi:ribosomal protein L7/L12